MKGIEKLIYYINGFPYAQLEFSLKPLEHQARQPAQPRHHFLLATFKQVHYLKLYYHFKTKFTPFENVCFKTLYCTSSPSFLQYVRVLLLHFLTGRRSLARNKKTSIEEDGTNNF